MSMKNSKIRYFRWFCPPQAEKNGVWGFFTKIPRKQGGIFAWNYSDCEDCLCSFEGTIHQWQMVMVEERKVPFGTSGNLYHLVFHFQNSKSIFFISLKELDHVPDWWHQVGVGLCTAMTPYQNHCHKAVPGGGGLCLQTQCGRRSIFVGFSKVSWNKCPPGILLFETPIRGSKVS